MGKCWTKSPYYAQRNQNRLGNDDGPGLKQTRAGVAVLWFWQYENRHNSLSQWSRVVLDWFFHCQDSKKTNIASSNKHRVAA